MNRYECRKDWRMGNANNYTVKGGKDAALDNERPKGLCRSGGILSNEKTC